MGQQYDKMGSAEFEVGPMDARSKTERRASPPQAKRAPVDYLYSKLNWDFIKMMAQIAQYAAGKYGAAERYTESRLEGEKAPINHVFEHARAYLTDEPHDHFGTVGFQLAAVAYNAMMEYFYFTCGAGVPAGGLFYPRELPPSSAIDLKAQASRSGPLTNTPISVGYTPGPRQAIVDIPRADSFKGI